MERASVEPGEAVVEREPILRRLSLRANFSWTFVGNFVNALCQWGMLTALAKLGDATVVGQYTLGLAIATPVIMFAMLQLRAVQATDAREEHDFDAYFGLRLVTVLIALAVIGGIAVYGGYENRTSWVIFWIGVAKAVDAIADIFRGLFQRHERMDYSGISFMIKGPVALGALALVFIRTGDIVQATMSMALAWSASVVLYDMRQGQRLLRRRSQTDGRMHHLRPRFDPPEMLKLTWIAFPLGVVMFLIALQVSIPRVLLERYWDEAALGYFGAIAYPLVAGTMIVTALGQAVAPRLANYYIDNLRGFQRLQRKLQGIGLVLGIGLVAGVALFGHPALVLLYKADYGNYHREFLVAAIAAAIQFNVSFFGYGLTAARVFRSLAGITAVACAVTIAAAFILVPRWGVMGGSLTMLASAIVNWIVYIVAVQWVVRRRRQEERRLADEGGRAPCVSETDL